MSSSFNSKRVAKNTVILYVRMIFMMLISLYTSRVILSTLGVEDYGVYNVVGGMVSMFGILSASLSTAISRFITFSLGKGDKEELQRIFSTAIIIEVGLAVIIGLLVEVIGVWYLYNKMVIPDGRLTAAFWVLQCTVLSFGLGLFGVPFDAEIVAHEKMDIYAYFSIADAVIALLIVYLLRIIPADKLIVFAVLNVSAAILMKFVYAVYCRYSFEECRFRFKIDKQLLKELGSFAGWNMLAQGAWILNTQGVELLVNSFFGVAMNAARGVAGQVNGAVGKFAGNFMAAVNPQITKTYAEGNLQAMHLLIFRATRLSMFLTALFAIPIIVETPYILDLWLETVPDRAVLFTRLVILSSLVNQVGGTMVTAQLATGNIKRYQIIITLCGVWVFPLTWVAFRLGFSVEWCYYIFIFVYFALIFIRIYLVKDLIQLPVKDYLRRVLLRIAVVLVAALPLPILFHYMMPEGFMRLVVVLVLSTLSLGICVYYLGSEPVEREVAVSYVKNKIKSILFFSKESK